MLSKCLAQLAITAFFTALDICRPACSVQWFIMGRTGSTRLYSAQQSKEHLPGQLPGFNAPAVTPGSVVLGPGDIAYSPHGSVHYFAREADSEENFDVHASGYAIPTVS
jgi:hypothetical protein